MVATTNHAGVHGISHPLEVVETVLEVADVAWNAYEHHRGSRVEASARGSPGDEKATAEEEDGDLEKLRSENQRLRAVLAENLDLLKNLSESPAISSDCPQDLYPRLAAAVNSDNFLSQLEALNQASTVSSHNCFPFEEVKGEDLETIEILVYDGNGEPSRWVWITQGVESANMEEPSRLDNENYVVINDEDVVDGIANFLAKCILANPRSKDLSPEELQKTVTTAMGGMKDWRMLKNVWHAGKLIYALSTWGIALSALYGNRAVVKAAAKGVATSAKFMVKAL